MKKVLCFLSAVSMLCSVGVRADSDMKELDYRHLGVDEAYVYRQLSKAEMQDANLTVDDPISSYETFIPRNSQPKISKFESAVLTRYLDNPKDVKIAQFLAVYHLRYALGDDKKWRESTRLKHSIIALYFLNRVQDLGRNDPWVNKYIKKLNKKIDKVTNYGNALVSLDESREAHSYFLETFNYKEENRFIAADKLLADYVQHPNSMHTTFLNNAVNLWIGGEADYDDPTILYNFVVGSFFSIKAMSMAQQLEIKWKQDPVNNSRYRMATILGGFTALQRGWLAALHQDQLAIDAINDEHREWRLIHRVFHSFTVGLAFYENPYTFLEAKNAWDEGFAYCDPSLPEIPRTCPGAARFSFNPEGMTLTYVDFYLKLGDLDQANFWMFVLGTFYPNFSYWDLGKDAYQHRANNLQAISDRYQNADPSDDPLFFFMKKKQWGTNTSTCQTCHQAQSKIWSQEEKDEIILPPESYATVGNWPAVSTTWYGAIKNL